VSRPSRRICCFRGAERFDELQERPLGENYAPETSMAGKTAPCGGAKAVDIKAACAVDSFSWSTGCAVSLEQVAEHFCRALANADVWAL
jgi:hypothetical protein